MMICSKLTFAQVAKQVTNSIRSQFFTLLDNLIPSRFIIPECKTCSVFFFLSNREKILVMSGSSQILLGLLPVNSLRQLCQFSNEHMILALAGQFKQLSHELEKFR